MSFLEEVGFAVEPKEWWREQGNDAPTEEMLSKTLRAGMGL